MTLRDFLIPSALAEDWTGALRRAGFEVVPKAPPNPEMEIVGGDISLNGSTTMYWQGLAPSMHDSSLVLTGSVFPERKECRSLALSGAVERAFLGGGCRARGHCAAARALYEAGDPELAALLARLEAEGFRVETGFAKAPDHVATVLARRVEVDLFYGCSLAAEGVPKRKYLAVDHGRKLAQRMLGHYPHAVENVAYLIAATGARATGATLPAR